MTGRSIHSDKAGGPYGHYSQAMEAQGWVFVSLLLSSPKPGTPATIAGETVSVLASLRAIVEAAGGGLTDVVRVVMYVTDIADWDEVNRTYAATFGEHRPARSVVNVVALHRGSRVGLEAVAFVAPDRRA